MKAFQPKDARILVVDDSPDDSFVLARALDGFGIKKRKIDVVPSGEDALAVLEQEAAYDIALIDYRLPGMDGLELVRHIHERYPKTQPILVTGSRDGRVAASAMKEGAADYVAKDDFLTSALIRTLQAVLRNSEDADQTERRELLDQGGDGFVIAKEELHWLREHREDGRDVADAGAVPEILVRFLKSAMEAFPEPALHEEEEITRMVVNLGLGPRAFLAMYSAAIRSLELDGVNLTVSPTLLLTELLVALVEEYQTRESIRSVGKDVA